MGSYICVTCGNQYKGSDTPPSHCPICEDERQYVHPDGQSWTTLQEIQQQHHNVLKTLEPGLSEIVTVPQFAIGQRALLVQTPKGNVLWDCVSLIDDATIAEIEALGGISSLAMSHPHMYGSMVEWSHAFGDAPIYLHRSAEKWISRPDAVIQFWDEDVYQINQAVTLHRCGGHFESSTLLHWSPGAKGRGVLLTSDTMHVTPDHRHVSFMRSFPNYIPLSAVAVEAVTNHVESIDFDRVYSHFAGLVIDSDAKDAVRRSANRYKESITR